MILAITLTQWVYIGLATICVVSIAISPSIKKINYDEEPED